MPGEYLKGPNRVRPTEGVYEDPNYDWRVHDPGLADDLQEEILDTEKFTQGTGAPDAGERDALRHQEAVFLRGLPEAVTANLSGQGIKAVRAVADGHGTGYLISCRDREGRTFDARLTFDAMISFGQRFGAKMGQRIVEQICRDVLAERERWFARMRG